ncbi:unnamed protein product, partial [Rotaria sordida]
QYFFYGEWYFAPPDTLVALQGHSFVAQPTQQQAQASTFIQVCKGYFSSGINPAQYFFYGEWYFAPPDTLVALQGHSFVAQPIQQQAQASTFIQVCKGYFSSGINPAVKACIGNVGCVTNNVHAKQLEYHQIRNIILLTRNII